MTARDVLITQGFTHVVFGDLLDIKVWHPSNKAQIVGYGTVRDFGETVIAVTRPVAPGAMEHIVERR
jgi:hypothetical protein